MLRMSIHRIITNIHVFDIIKTITDVLFEMEADGKIDWKYCSKHKYKNDYNIVYEVIESGAYYNIYLDYYSEGFGMIYVGYDTNSRHDREIEKSIYKKLEKIDDGSEINVYNTTRRVLLNKILTTKPLKEVEQAIVFLLDKMKEENKIKLWGYSDVCEEKGDTLLLIHVFEEKDRRAIWDLTTLHLREGYTIINVSGTYYARYDEEFVDRLMEVLR